MKISLLPIGIVLIILGVVLILLSEQEKAAIPTYVLIAGVVVVAVYALRNLKEMGRRSTMYGLNAVLMCAIMIAILVVIYLIAENRDKTWDFTASGKYTLDPQTTKILQELERPVKILGFYQNKDRRTTEFIEISQLLEEYERVGDNFSFQIVDPQKEYEVAEKYAKDLNWPHPTIIAEMQLGEDSFTEKAAGSTQEAITNAIRKVTHREPVTAYFLIGHYERGIEDQGSNGLSFLMSNLEGENINANPLRFGAAAGIPEDANLIALVGPQEDLNEIELEALRLFVLKGGALFVALDPDHAPKTAEKMTDFGVDMTTGILIEMALSGGLEALLTKRMTARPTTQVTVGTYHKEHDITKDLSANVVFYKGLGVNAVPSPADGITVTEILKTAGGTLSGHNFPNSWLDSNPKQLQAEGVDVNEIYDPSTDKEGPISIACAIEFNLDVVFEGKPDPGNPEKKGKIIVVGDSDFLTNGGIQQAGRGAPRSHMDLALNMFNWLAGQVDLISIREKEIEHTSLVLGEAQERFARNLCVIVIPLIFALMGVSVGIYRRKHYV